MTAEKNISGIHHQYESNRSEIERRLPPLRPDAYRHAFKSPGSQSGDGQTVVTSHGTGDNEPLTELTV